MTLTIEVISDVICPWCLIGKRRMEKAIAALGVPVKVRWLPFELNPTMLKEAISRREYRIKKFGSWERSQELDARVIAVGKEDGIDFAFDRIERTPNTLEAHRLIWLADKECVQDAIVETQRPLLNGERESLGARLDQEWVRGRSPQANGELSPRVPVDVSRDAACGKTKTPRAETVGVLSKPLGRRKVRKPKELPETNPLRNSALFFDFRKC